MMNKKLVLNDPLKKAFICPIEDYKTVAFYLDRYQREFVSMNSLLGNVEIGVSAKGELHSLQKICLDDWVKFKREPMIMTEDLKF